MLSPRQRLASIGFALALGIPLLALPAVLSTAEAASRASAPKVTAQDDASAPKAARIYRRCHGQRATIVAGNRGTTIRGTRGRDIIQANGGNDRIRGRGGRDLICAGRGRDIVDGGRGRDRVYGGRGLDFCTGNAYEHRRLHFGCEIHGPSGGPPPVPSAGAAPRTPEVAKSAPTTRRAKRAATYRYDSPVCQSGNIVLGNAYLTGYTNPGEVAIAEIVYRLVMSGDTPTWVTVFDGTTNPGYERFNIPDDGQTYTVPRGNIQSSPNGVYWVDYVIWWAYDGVNYDATASPNVKETIPWYVDAQAGEWAQICWT